jgi:hypothetical protein
MLVDSHASGYLRNVSAHLIKLVLRNVWTDTSNPTLNQQLGGRLRLIGIPHQVLEQHIRIDYQRSDGQQRNLLAPPLDRFMRLSKKVSADHWPSMITTFTRLEGVLSDAQCPS